MQNAGSDLYVLPEMFATGFATSPQGMAEPATGGSTLCWMQRVAQEYDAAIAGSVAVTDETTGLYYNRFYFVMPDGTYHHYDKHHLFTYGGEHRYYTAGEQRTVVEYRGVRFLLLVCYDLRFPVWSRNSDEMPYDVMLYVASWPAPRIEAWRTLLRARAIENQCYVAGVNRVGTDPYCTYPGFTTLVNAYGKAEAECKRDTPSAITCIIDMNRLRAFRMKFPVLNDRD